MANRERLVSTLMDLIRIDSPTGEEDEMDREVTARLQALGFRVEHDSFNNVVAKLDGDGEPVILSAHLDTVEPGRGIRPQLDGDLLRSDGTTILGGDCKAGVAIVLEALTSALESGSESGQKSRPGHLPHLPPHLPVEVVFTRAEEGGLVGAHHLDFDRITARRGVVFDGEGPGEPPDRGRSVAERGQGQYPGAGPPTPAWSRKRAFRPWSSPGIS